MSQLNVLVVTAKLDLARPVDVCRLLQLDTSPVSRNVERMRAKCWLETVPVEDARMQSFRLTDQGRKLLERAAPLWENAQEKAAQLLGHDGVALLAKTAQRLAVLDRTR